MEASESSQIFEGWQRSPADMQDMQNQWTPILGIAWSHGDGSSWSHWISPLAAPDLTPIFPEINLDIACQITQFDCAR